MSSQQNDGCFDLKNGVSRVQLIFDWNGMINEQVDYPTYIRMNLKDIVTGFLSLSYRVY